MLCGFCADSNREGLLKMSLDAVSEQSKKCLQCAQDTRTPMAIMFSNEISQVVGQLFIDDALKSAKTLF